MKKLVLFISILLLTCSLNAQNYLKLQTFELDNGLKVYLLPDSLATLTYGAVAVNAGSKNDPADATGLAHYLEHLLFKGTTFMGTVDYEKEKPFLDSITIYYQQLGKTKDEVERNKIKALINNQALQASKYGLPTEFHSLLSSIGGTAINAFTSNDMTVYHNSFPGEQMSKWLDLYSQRFNQPVFRSFQSELEVVYEEKNRASDNFQFELMTKLFKNLFPNHPYGTQTALGSTEHLKNPPIDRIYEFFNTYYVANNMALFLVGNFDVDKTIPLIQEKFARLRTGSIPAFASYSPQAFNANQIEKLRVTPIKVDILGFKSIAQNHPDEVALEVCNNLLFNESQTGLLNKLQQNGKLLAAFASSLHLHDDGAELIIIVPKILGQSFHKAEKFVFAQIDSIANGNFSDEFLANIKNELIKNYKNEMENPESRGNNLLTVFNTGKAWEEIVAYPEKVNQVTKEQVVAIAKKYYKANYYSIQSKTGFPKKDKIDKPGFKPVVTQQTNKSSYAKEFESIADPVIQPKFLDFSRDVVEKDMGKGNHFFGVKNNYNDIASLTVNYYIGTEKIPNLSLASQLLNECAPEGMSLESFKEALAKLNCTLNFYAGDDFFEVQLNGDEKNLASAMELANKLLKHPVPSKDAKKNLEQGVKAEFEQEEKDPATMGNVLRTYALYGNESEYKKRASLQQVKKMSAATLLGLINEAIGYSASFHYCGNINFDEVETQIKTNFVLAEKGIASLSYQETKPINKTIIYLVNDTKARQNQVYFSLLGDAYKSSEDGSLQLLAQYIGGSFSGLILQEIREYRSLAYTAGGRFTKPVKEGKPLLFTSFVGCQADKTNESIDVMLGLINDLPKYPDRIKTFKTFLLSTVSTRYPQQRELSEKIEELKLKGFESDPLMGEFNSVKNSNFETVYSFYERNIKGKPLLITIYGDKSKIDMEKLKTYGEIIEIKKDDIATY
jgi:zinc protease